MLNNIIIYGPPGCGKSTRGTKFKNFYKKDKVVEWDVFNEMNNEENLVVLTNEEPCKGYEFMGTWIHFDKAVMAMNKAGMG